MDDGNRIMALAGAALAGVAALAWLADWRRHHRRDLDRAGWVPWTMVFFWAFMGAVLLLGADVRAWLAG